MCSGCFFFKSILIIDSGHLQSGVIPRRLTVEFRSTFRLSVISLHLLSGAVFPDTSSASAPQSHRPCSSKPLCVPFLLLHEDNPAHPRDLMFLDCLPLVLSTQTPSMVSSHCMHLLYVRVIILHLLILLISTEPLSFTRL